MCCGDGVEPCRSYFVALMVRLPVVLHERAVVFAASQGKSSSA
jgi:predicted HicB family RNase H-like nuclease